MAADHQNQPIISTTNSEVSVLLLWEEGERLFDTNEFFRDKLSFSWKNNDHVDKKILLNLNRAIHFVIQLLMNCVRASAQCYHYVGLCLPQNNFLFLALSSELNPAAKDWVQVSNIFFFHLRNHFSLEILRRRNNNETHDDKVLTSFVSRRRANDGRQNWAGPGRPSES